MFSIHYSKGGRLDLIDNETVEINILKELLPADITAEQIVAVLKTLIGPIEPIKKNMGMFIKKIKETYPTADGKLVSNIVMKFLGLIGNYSIIYM